MSKITDVIKKIGKAELKGEAMKEKAQVRVNKDLAKGAAAEKAVEAIVPPNVITKK